MVANDFSHINIYTMEESSLTQPNANEISEEEKKNIVSLQEYIDDLNKRQKWRQQLRKANTDTTNRLDESELRKFDSSLKKVNFCTLNMRYIKKSYLRVMNCPLHIHFLSFRIQLLYYKLEILTNQEKRVY